MSIRVEVHFTAGDAFDGGGNARPENERTLRLRSPRLRSSLNPTVVLVMPDSSTYEVSAQDLKRAILACLE